MDIEQTDDYVEENFEAFLSDLKELLSQPSISSEGEGVDECASLVEEYCKDYGFDETRIERTSGNPYVIAQAFVDHDPENEKPTVLIYGHFDVQPVREEEWDTPPFEPTVRKGPEGRERMYARGAGDNKGQWFAHLCAVKTWREMDDIPINVTLILDGEEEIGSPNIHEVVADNRDLFEADVAMIADGPMDDSWTPDIHLGARGILYMQMDLKGPNRDLHSGNFGGPVPSPAWELVDLLSGMKDESGKVTIDGFYDEVREINEEMREILDDIPFEIDTVKEELEIDGLADGPGDTYLEKLMYHPTLNIAGLTSGYQGEGSKAVLPSTARAKVDIRLVKNQQAGDIFEKFKTHVHDNIDDDKVDIEIEKLGDAMKPWLTPVDSDFLDPILDAVEDGWKMDPIVKPVSGGSLPGAVFTEDLDLHLFSLAYANPDESNHSPNENLVLECFKNGIKTTTRILKNLC